MDDEIDILSLIEFVLEEETKWRVLLSSSGQEGLIQAQREVPDIILSDIYMPQMNGIEMIRRLRSQSKTQNIPILLMTSLPHNIQLQVLYQLGISQVIAKPFDPLILVDLMVSTFQSSNISND
ncbi:response regulator [Myxosarcina sp. GI1]|uniref:response regulator n=1 Tax=Myxosarcina sp. GI1 TaxID=1541065 RepID=UPI00155A2097|nr:response regulator [Myxosarcina sp. GI1]